MIRISSSELLYQAAIRGWSMEKTAREAAISVATVWRAMRGMPVRGITALQLVQAFRRHAPCLSSSIWWKPRTRGRRARADRRAGSRSLMWMRGPIRAGPAIACTRLRGDRPGGHGVGVACRRTRR